MTGALSPFCTGPDTHVAVLRRKLGHGAAEAGYITTVAKAGYRMLA